MALPNHHAPHPSSSNKMWARKGGKRNWAYGEPEAKFERDEVEQDEQLINGLLNAGHTKQSANNVFCDIRGYRYFDKADLRPASSRKGSSSPLARPEASRASSSPLSEASRIQSPTVPTISKPAKAPSLDSDDSSVDEKQPPPAPTQPQFQTFGSNPLTFDDPTVYEIRDVTEDMTDEEKKEIYCVSSFPKDDLHDLIAGTPPNKDFSNAVKPSNQVQAHTFAGYLDGFLRPLKEEDIGFLHERVGTTSNIKYVC